MNVTQEEIFSIIENVGVSVDVAKIKANMPFNEAGVDSLELINIILEVEEKFGIKIPDEDIDTLNTVDNIVSYLQKI
jgi:acyl carrier protein